MRQEMWPTFESRQIYISSVFIISKYQVYLKGERYFGAADSAAISTFQRRFLFFFLIRVMRKNNETGNFLIVVEREPFEIRVLNPTESEASYKPKQRS